MYRMTYNYKEITGCSARGIAKRESKEELLELAKELEDSICDIKIEKVTDIDRYSKPLDIFTNMKKLDKAI